MASNGKILIIAGNAAEAGYAARQLGLEDKQWKYVRDADDLASAPRPVSVIRYGTWIKRRDKDQLRDALYAAGSRDVLMLQAVYW